MQRLIVALALGVCYGFVPANRPGAWFARHVERKSDSSGFMPSETPQIYIDEAKAMISAMDDYVKGSEEIYSAGVKDTSDVMTEYLPVPSSAEMVKDLFGDSSIVGKLADEAAGKGGPFDAAAAVKGAVFEEEDESDNPFARKHTADWCDVEIWWRAPDVVKTRFGEDSKAYKMAQAAYDEVMSQTDASLLEASEAYADFAMTYGSSNGLAATAAEMGSLSAADKASVEATAKDFVAPTDEEMAATVTDVVSEYWDEEAGAPKEAGWMEEMHKDSDEEFDKLVKLLPEDSEMIVAGEGTPYATYYVDVDSWTEGTTQEDSLGKIAAAYGSDSDLYKDAKSNWAEFAGPPSQEQFEESLKGFLGEDSDSWKFLKAEMDRRSFPSEKKEEPAPAMAAAGEAPPKKSKKSKKD